VCVSSWNERRKYRLLETSDFQEIITRKRLFVDKTLLIKEFMESNHLVAAILRPRGFGKSLNLSMLKSFLSLHEGNRIYFSKLNIGKYKSFMDKY
jgi:pantothenate kinase-related protein Tda10